MSVSRVREVEFHSNTPTKQGKTAENYFPRRLFQFFPIQKNPSYKNTVDYLKIYENIFKEFITIIH